MAEFRSYHRPYYGGDGNRNLDMVMNHDPNNNHHARSWSEPPPTTTTTTTTTRSSSQSVSSTTNNNNNKKVHKKSASVSSSSSSSASVGTMSSSSWSFNDPEMKRRKRVVKYKSYAVEGKVKASFGKGFRWIRNKYSEIV